MKKTKNKKLCKEKQDIIGLYTNKQYIELF